MSAPNQPPGRPAEGRGGAGLPKRSPGASPMAIAGARAGETTAPANGGGARYTIKRLGARPAPKGRRAVVIAAAVALLASGGAALAFLSQPAGHAHRAERLLPPVRSRALPPPPPPPPPPAAAPPPPPPPPPGRVPP